MAVFGTENALEVRKRGLIDVHMIFEEDKKNISFYHTPYGMINVMITIRTSTI